MAGGYYVMSPYRGGYSGNLTARASPMKTQSRMSPRFIKNVRTIQKLIRKAHNKHYGTLTNQHDVTTQYRRKTMPRWKRRRWVKFTKKVDAVSTRDLGTRTVLFNDSLQTHNSVADSQQYKMCSLYGRGGTESGINCGSKDLFEINANDDDIVAGSTVQFRSAVLDITFTNKKYGADPPLLTRNYTMEIDVYTLMYPYDSEPYADFTALLAAAYAMTPDINTTGNSILLEQRGATPFDLGNFISLGGIRIIAKRKYLISLGQSATFQYRDAGNKWIKGKDMATEDEDYIKRGLTTSFLIIYKPTDRDNSGVQSSGIEVNCSRHYTYKVVNKENNLSKNNNLI